MRRRAVLVHLNALVRVTPLVGGYLKATADADPEIRREWDIRLYSAYYRTQASTIIRDIIAVEPDLIGFSVYSWNVRLVLRLVQALRGLLPAQTQFLVGGVEVMHCADTFDPSWENVAVCNGEGELTFRDLLRELSSEQPALGRVKGLSFARDGAWRTNEPMPRLQDLNRIPSPWLEAIFTPDDLAEVALFETNRGCPFTCEYCFWGGAVGVKVNQFDLARVKEEIDYIAKHRTKAINICDANFGMLPRDVEIAEHLSSVKSQLKAPSRIIYSTAKNNPDRVEEIARLFTSANLLTDHTISLQTLNETALRLARRNNIKSETYMRLQRRLNEWKVSSFVELIWPLPGETLDSFKAGVETLCRLGTQSFTIYPLLWLNNVGYEGKEDDYGIALLQEDDNVGEGKIVIQTNEVSFADYLSGLVYSLAVYLLYNCRGLYTTALLLDTLGLASYRQIFDAFVARMERPVEGNRIVAMWHEGQVSFEEINRFAWRGELAHAALHECRQEFDALIWHFTTEFLETCDGITPAHKRLLGASLEFDLLSRPLPYLQTEMTVGVDLAWLAVRKQKRGIWTVGSPYDFPSIQTSLRNGAHVDPSEALEGPVEITIDHRSHQVFRHPGKSDEEHYWHMHQAVREIGSIEPVYATRNPAT